MTEKEWDKILKSMNEYAKKWIDEKFFKIKYKVIKDIINKEDLQNDRKP